MDSNSRKGSDSTHNNMLNSMYSRVFAKDLHDLPFKRKLASRTAISLNMQRVQHEQLCDVTVYSSSKTFLAHRCILASVSPYFNTLFTSPLIANKNDAGRWKADLSEFSCKSVDLLLCVIYNDTEFDSSLFVDVNIKEFMQLLDFTGMDDALEELTRAVAKYLTLSTCKDWYDTAIQYSLSHLEVMTMIFIGANFEQLVSTGKMNKYSLSFLEEMLLWEVIYCYDLAFLVHAVIQWIAEDTASRSNKIETLLPKVIHKETFNKGVYDTLLKLPLVIENLALSDLLLQWKEDNFIKAVDSIQTLDECVILFSYDREVNQSVIFDSTANTMTMMKDAQTEFLAKIFNGPLKKANYWEITQVRFFVLRCQLFYVFPKLKYDGGGRLLFYRYDQCSQECVPHGYMTLPAHLRFEYVSQVQAIADIAYISVRINRKRQLFVTFNMNSKVCQHKHLVIASNSRYDVSVTLEDKVMLVSSHSLCVIDYKADSLETYNLQSDSIDPSLLAEGHCVSDNDGNVYCCLNVNDKLCVLCGGDPLWTVLSESSQSRKLLRLFFCNNRLFGVFTEDDNGMCIIEFDITENKWSKDIVTIGNCRLKDYESILVMPRQILF